MWVTKMSDHDHPDTDLTDPHGEAEALRKENARLRAEIAEATDPDFIWGALDNVHDAETTLDDYAAAVSRAQRAALAKLGIKVVTDDDIRRAIQDAGHTLNAHTIAQAADAYRTLHRGEFAASRAAHVADAQPEIKALVEALRVSDEFVRSLGYEGIGNITSAALRAIGEGGE
jgi:hypothetical protein